MLETCSICVIFLIGIIAIVWLMYPRKSEPFRLTLGSQITDTPVKEEEYQPPPGVKTDFIINNYLPSRALSVTVLDPSVELGEGRDGDVLFRARAAEEVTRVVDGFLADRHLLRHGETDAALGLAIAAFDNHRCEAS